MTITVRGLSKTFHPNRGQAVTAVDDVSLDVEDAEFLVILGPSGSGKTTLLRCIAGLERPDQGEITVDGRIVYSSKQRTWIPPDQRGISMVFQSYALWPHMTVAKNIGYPLRSRRMSRAETDRRVSRALEIVECAHLAGRHPAELSGGQQQRVAVARAIVNDSKVVLFDEPLSSVDARVREELRRQLGALQRDLGFTALYITHDQTEATVLGHRVAVFADGRIAQIAPPRELYTRPGSSYVAGFMGAANQIRGKVVPSSSDHIVLETDLGPIVASGRGPDGLEGDADALAIFRPESVVFSSVAPSDAENHWHATVKSQSFLGFCTEYVLQVDQAMVLARSMDSRVPDVGSKVWISLPPQSVRVIGGVD
jgi:iron(III) transport system ATP-binding protein